MTSIPVYFKVDPPSEDSIRKYLVSALDDVIKDIFQGNPLPAPLTFLTKAVGVATLSEFVADIHVDGDFLYVNSAKLALDTLGTGGVAYAISWAAGKIAPALVAAGPLSIGAVVFGIGASALATYVWSTFDEAFSLEQRVEAVLGQQDVQFIYLKDGNPLSGAIYDNISPADIPSALDGLAYYAGAVDGSKIQMKQFGSETEYSVFGGNVAAKLVAAMGVPLSEFYSWGWAQDEKGGASTNAAQIIVGGPVGGEGSMSFINTGSSIALKIWKSDGSELENITIDIDNIGFGELPDDPTSGPLVIIGSDGIDVLRAGAQGSYIFGGRGDGDILNGGSGNDRIIADSLSPQYGERGINTLEGNGGKDLLVGGGGNDIIKGGSGEDVAFGYWGDDKIEGGSENDIIHGDSQISQGMLDGRDRLAGGDGQDKIYGSGGADILVGGDAVDFYDQSLRSFHPDWNDGERDLLAGGFGNDQYLISHRIDANYSLSLAASLSFVDIIDESSGDGRGDIKIQNFDSNTGEVKAIRASGFYEPVATSPEGTFYINSSYSVDDLGDDWVPKLVVSSILDELGQPYIFLIPEYPDWGAPYVAIRNFRQGDFGITISGYGGAREGTPGGDVIGGSGSRAFGSLDAGDANQNLSSDDAQRIHAGGGDDIVYGRNGQDEIRGEDGNDRLQGNRGDDLLTGGTGNDVFVYGRGDGTDTIRDAGGANAGQDKIEFTNVLASEVRLTQQGNDLIITILDSETGAGDGGSITLTGAMATNQGGTLPSIEFSDGTIWNPQQVITHITEVLSGEIAGTAQADQLEGTWEGDVLRGKGGNDSLSGMFGSDVYIYRDGDGSDIINDGVNVSSETDVLHFENLTASDVSLTRVGEALVITIAGSEDTITVRKQFLPNGYWGLERILFSDGTSLGRDEILSVGSGQPEIDFEGTDGADTIYGSGASELFSGGKGNDRLLGGGGSDIYIYSSGDGSDFIDDEANESTSIDTLRLVDLNPDDVSASRRGENLVLTDLTTGHTITIDEQWYSDTGYWGFERIEFLDGTVWNRATIMAIPVGPIVGSPHNDEIEGSHEDDVIQGGRGDDTIEGYSGSDIYLYAMGDGNDLIRDGGSDLGAIDKLILSNLTAGQVTAARQGIALVLTVLSTNQTITLTNQYYSSSMSYGLETIQFAGGAVWDRQHLMQLGFVPTMNGTANADVLTGIWFDETLRGGLGNDQLIGDQGSDTYIYANGDGSDIIDDSGYDAADTDRLSFTDLTADQIVAQRQGDDLMLTVKANGHSITIDDQFRSSTGFHGLEVISFADGTAWDRASIMAIQEPGLTLSGTIENESLVGATGDDLLDGKGGSDWLKGGAGSDTYVYSLGDGNDNIDDDANLQTSDIDVLRFTNIGPAGVSLAKVGPDLEITIAATGEVIKVYDQFAAQTGSPGLERIEFSDGTYWDRVVILSAPVGPIRGTEAAEVLSGSDGDDVIISGRGDDYLMETVGSDSYTFSSGDGNDIIMSGADRASDVDILKFTDVTASQISLVRNGNALLVKVLPTNQTIEVWEQFAGQGFRGIEKIEFANGVIWNHANIVALGNGAPQTRPPTIVGGTGNDVLNGTVASDVIAGHQGNDVLQGGWGADSYLYNVGDGHDTIEDWDNPESIDTLWLGSGINSGSTLVTRGTEGFWDIVLNFATSSTITIKNGFFAASSVIEEVKFNNGIVWDLSDLRVQFLKQASTSGGDEIYGFLDSHDVITGGGGSDTLNGLGGNDALSGDAGDDTLVGEEGNDRLIGGVGADSLFGNSGSDIYAYESGDSNDYLNDEDSDSIAVDVLQLTDLNLTQVEFMRSGVSLIMTVVATGQTIFINNQFNQQDGGYWGIEKIEFAGGSSWNLAQINDVGWIRGTSGNDSLTGTWRQEILSGGSGNDSLNGDWGDDTYIFNLGDGHDTIQDWDNPEATDILQLGAGISANSVSVERGAAGFWDMVLDFGTSGSVTITNGLYSASTVIERVNVADGTVWTLNDLQTLHLQQSATSAGDTLFGFIDRNDVINGGAGNDDLTGFSGNDTLLGGIGDDSLSGDEGGDTLEGGAGNDSLTGGDGSDVFVFKSDFGFDWVQDFTAGAGTDDVIEIADSPITDFQAILAAASQEGINTVIALDANNTITLHNVMLSNLHADDFRFVA
ncbi:calcium-binding protein [Neorhizobium sp. S3-V5DH]|uniref:calcium-binding protein n=1 Tax=Neorhizobium sp. S3-V5DH TaxID=2485166 RepID=UPI0010444B50|nr:calcium-binding protein [Neorhizobium sp. S3-V5DH]